MVSVVVKHHFSSFRLRGLSQWLPVSLPLCLQDSLRFLVQDSLTSFTQMVVDACISVTNIPDNFEWGTDLLTSNYK